MPDVDIDFFDRDGVLKLFKHTPATIIKDNKTEKHKTGVYFHAVPEHPVTGHSSLDYKKAEDGIRDSPQSRGLGDVYKRQAGKKMLKSFSDEQLQMTQRFINPEYWANKFKSFPADYMLVQDTAKEARIE